MRRFFSSTVNANEVSKFTRAAKYNRPICIYACYRSHPHRTRACSDWWKPASNTGVGLLHQLNPTRVSYIRCHVIEHFGKDPCRDAAWPLKGLRTLDVGCGGGILSESLARLGGDVTGVDPGQANIDAASAHAEQDDETENIRYICTTADALVAQNETFDVVCALEVVEHVDDVPAFIQSLTQLVKPHELTAWIQEHGLQVSNVSGIVGDPYVQGWKLHPTCTEINYILAASSRKCR
ncbi:hypothetical protein DYB34_006722 [Aphanomyces astaci]|uniref:Methyltransferase type 11 domain-containing protein n=1 Tax=Aphanomyces astaci TaxID=112090 RepID=A0A418C5Q5_APHAT|nr:hypothetical protein DYB34_006722 [Aphanomyces astaci]